MASTRIVVNGSAIRTILDTTVAPAITDLTESIARTAESFTGLVNGLPADMDVYTGITQSGARFRGAVVAHHATPKGRQAAADALAATAGVSARFVAKSTRKRKAKK